MSPMCHRTWRLGPDPTPRVPLLVQALNLARESGTGSRALEVSNGLGYALEVALNCSVAGPCLAAWDLAICALGDAPSGITGMCAAECSSCM